MTKTTSVHDWAEHFSDQCNDSMRKKIHRSVKNSHELLALLDSGVLSTHRFRLWCFPSIDDVIVLHKRDTSNIRMADFCAVPRRSFRDLFSKDERVERAVLNLLEFSEKDIERYGVSVIMSSLRAGVSPSLMTHAMDNDIDPSLISSMGGQ
jgi:hypothetical protein